MTGHKTIRGRSGFYNSYKGVCPSSYPCLPVPSYDSCLARTPRANHVHSVTGLVCTNQYSVTRSTRLFSSFPSSVFDSFCSPRSVILFFFCLPPWPLAVSVLASKPMNRFTEKTCVPEVIPKFGSFSLLLSILLLFPCNKGLLF